MSQEAHGPHRGIREQQDSSEHYTSLTAMRLGNRIQDEGYGEFTARLERANQEGGNRRMGVVLMIRDDKDERSNRRRQGEKATRKRRVWD